MYHRALAGFEVILGSQHTSTLQIEKNLAFLYQSDFKLDLAEQLYRSVLEVEEKILGPTHSSTLDTVHSLGILYFRQGKEAEGKSMCLRVSSGNGTEADILWKAFEKAKQQPRRPRLPLAGLPPLGPYSNWLIQRKSTQDTTILPGIDKSSFSLTASVPPKSRGTWRDDWNRLLLEKIFDKDLDESYVYEMAMEEGNEALLCLLLENSLRILPKNCGPQTNFLHWAASRGNESAVELLLKNMATMGPRHFILSDEAVDGKKNDLLLTTEGETSIINLWNPVIYEALVGAIRSLPIGKESIVRTLLDTGVDIKASGVELLESAAWNGNEDIFLLLLLKGAEFYPRDTTSQTPWDTTSQTLLRMAAARGHVAITRLLISLGLDPDTKYENGETALFVAASEGRVEVAQLLVEKGADVNAQNEYGETALHEAASAWFGGEPISRLLLEEGAYVDAKDSHAQTPLFKAISFGREPEVRLLLENGADIEAKDSFGQTALHRAALHGKEPLGQLLLEKGADIKAKTSCACKCGWRIEDGWTALHWASSEGHEAAVRLLLERGAEVDAKDKYGRTALHLVVIFGHPASVPPCYGPGMRQWCDCFSRMVRMCR